MAEVRVLVVDDEATARDLLIAILEDDGYRVLAVADGASALEAAETFKPTWPFSTAACPVSTESRWLGASATPAISRSSS